MKEMLTPQIVVIIYTAVTVVIQVFVPNYVLQAFVNWVSLKVLITANDCDGRKDQIV